MVAWIKRTWAKLFGGGAAVVARPVGQKVCPTCGAMMPADPVDTFDYENWKPDPAPPDKIEQGEAGRQDHVFAAHTYYHVASKQAGAFDSYPNGEGDPENFVILRSSRKLPPQHDENGRCRQLDLEGLEEQAEKCFAGTEEESPLDNVFDADKLSDEEFGALWLEGSEKDLAYWSQKAVASCQLPVASEKLPPAESVL